MADAPRLPAMEPPTTTDASTGAAQGDSSPTLTEDQFAIMAGESLAESAPGPGLAPPRAATEDEGAGAATWHTNVRVDALWAVDETRNAWAHIAGVGWRKIFNGRDGSFQALATLAGQARQTNRPVTMREENDGMIHTIYLW